MFITENQSVTDSVLFLMAARTSLANIAESSISENTDALVDFIYNEASDYQVMHLLLQGSLPDRKYDPASEAALFSAFKESMLINKGFVTEMVGENIFENILYEVDSLYMATSTTKSVLEFESHSDPEVALACYISEGPSRFDFSRAMSNADLAKKKLMHAVSSTKGNDAADSIERLRKLKQKHKAMSDMSGSSTAIAKHKVGSAIASGKAALGKGAAAVSKFATTKAGIATGGAAAAALAIYAGYKIYKRFFSQAAKACAGQGGAAKTACMNKYKKQAIMKQAATIQSNSSTCAKSKDPAKCKAAIAAKVASLKAKAAKVPA